MVAIFKHFNMCSNNVSIINFNKQPWNVKASNNMFDKVTQLEMKCRKRYDCSNLILFLFMNPSPTLFKNVITLKIDHCLLYGEYNQTKPKINLFNFPSLKHISLNLENARAWDKTEPILIPETIESFSMNQLYFLNTYNQLSDYEQLPGGSPSFRAVPFVDCLPMTFENIKQSQMQNIEICINSWPAKKLNQKRCMIEIFNLCNQFPKFKCLKLNLDKIDLELDLERVLHWFQSLKQCEIKIEDWLYHEPAKQITIQFWDSASQRKTRCPPLRQITENEYQFFLTRIQNIFQTHLFPKSNLKLQFKFNRIVR